jgi:GT2 family glycosyltransferase
MTAAIVIGRNEADHLALALASAAGVGGPVIYVDSASSDASVSVARAAGVPVVELTPPPILSAARGRNAGLEWLDGRFPHERYVIFLDGDCVLHPDFGRQATSVMDADMSVAIVVGHLRERTPDANIFSRLSSLEWSSRAGEIRDFGNLGGIMCARVCAVQSVGAFNPQMIAGEDSELGVRLALAGFRILKIDADMATHDNGISSFRSWWRRSVRAGHALAQRYVLNGRTAVGDCRREFASTILWGLVLPACALLLAWPTKGLSLALVGGYLVLGVRMGLRLARSGCSTRDATAAAFFGVISKFANAAGLCRFFWNARTGEFRIIEYKRPAGSDVGRR